MVSSLQSKKEALEAKLKNKTNELKRLCIEEAELTGFLPPDTPLEPGESPPTFRRRVGTSFTIPENLINRAISKEDEALVKLELEVNIQRGITEAALGLANDLTACKSVRRTHRVLYEESQKKLLELEAKLGTLKQQQQVRYNKKKLRPTKSEAEIRIQDDPEDTYTPLGYSLSDRGLGLPRSQSSLNYIKPEHSPYNFRNWHTQGVRTPDQSKISRSTNANYLKNVYWGNRETGVHFSRQHSPVDHNHDWWKSLDRGGYESRAFTLPRNLNNPTTTAVLLPNQTYPDSSLMRAQSLGNVDKVDKSKPKEKEWYETSLDSSPTLSLKRERLLSKNGSGLPSPKEGVPFRSSSVLQESVPLGLPPQSIPSLPSPSYSSHSSYTDPPVIPYSSPPPPPVPRSMTPSTQPQPKTFPYPPIPSPSLPIMNSIPTLGLPPPPPIPYNSLPSPTPSLVSQTSTTIHMSSTSPSPSLPDKPSSPSPPALPLKTHQATVNNVHFDIVVPYETPKNHTVVEAGKFQPYREETKPFEMSDFYKYSTKYRNPT